MTSGGKHCWVCNVYLVPVLPIRVFCSALEFHRAAWTQQQPCCLGALALPAGSMGLAWHSPQGCKCALLKGVNSHRATCNPQHLGAECLVLGHPSKWSLHHHGKNQPKALAPLPSLLTGAGMTSRNLQAPGA